MHLLPLPRISHKSLVCFFNTFFKNPVITSQMKKDFSVQRLSQCSQCWMPAYWQLGDDTLLLVTFYRGVVWENYLLSLKSAYRVAHGSTASV